MTHPDHVLCVLGLALRAAPALGDHERLKTLFLRPSQDVDGWDVRIPRGAALVLAGREDRWRSEAHLLFTERRRASNDVGVARETGGKLGHVLSFQTEGA